MEDREETISKITQLLNVLPNKDIDALERIVWSMSKTSDRQTVYRAHDKYRVYICFNEMRLWGPQAFHILLDQAKQYKDNFIFIIYSRDKYPDITKGGTLRKIYVSEMKDMCTNYFTNKEYEKYFIFTLDEPERNKQTLIDPQIFNLPQILQNLPVV